MTAVPHQVTDFLRTSAPFDSLTVDGLNSVARLFDVLYVTSESLLEVLGDEPSGLFLIQSGQFTVTDSEAPEQHLSEGAFFGYPAHIDDVEYPIHIVVDKPGIIYHLDSGAFSSLLDEYPNIRQFFAHAKQDTLHNQAVDDAQSMWLYKSLDSLIERAPVMAERDISIQQAAAIMSAQGVSSLLITANGKLEGIMTDRDLRTRVVTTGIDLSEPIEDVMTPDPARIKHSRTLFDAMALMGERHIHHLPVVGADNSTPLGMVTATDIIRQQRGNVLFVVGELSKAKNLYELTRAAWQIPQYFASHAKRPGDFDIAGKALTQATDVMTRKLIQFYQQKHGPAPMEFCWLVYGSQAREDQTMGSDQDNGLLLADEPSEQAERYFTDFSEYVCEGLAKCGIELCAGNIMASNHELRRSLASAVTEAEQWVSQPTSEAIMHFNIFLDARAVAGNSGLFDTLQSARAPLFKRPMFLAALARHANEASVPLSIFQKFVFAKGHKQGDCIDLKVNAIAIINNLIRLYSLAEGIRVPSTLQRVERLQGSSYLSPKDAKNLKDIWLFLNRLRWRHQLTQNVTDNLVSISELSSIEKHQLKASFKAIHQAQQAAVLKFSGGVG